MNKLLANELPLPPIGPMDSPHTKAHLLFQAHFSRIKELPIIDYRTDTQSILDQAIRILQVSCIIYFVTSYQTLLGNFKNCLF